MLVENPVLDRPYDQANGNLAQRALSQEAHVYLSDFDTIQSQLSYTDALSFLNKQETEGLAKIKSTHRFNECLYGRAALKKQLGCYLNCHPRDVELERDSFNKPIVGTSFCGRKLEFNVSHSGNRFAMIFSLDQPVGIDIEVIDDKLSIKDLATIAERNFTHEELAYLNRVCFTRYKQTFFKIWTLKEALLKALGIGLFLPLNHINFNLNQFTHTFQISEIIASDKQTTRLDKYKTVNARLMAANDSYSLAIASTTNLADIKFYDMPDFMKES